jgi:hypothetical protein
LFNIRGCDNHADEYFRRGILTVFGTVDIAAKEVYFEGGRDYWCTTIKYSFYGDDEPFMT